MAKVVQRKQARRDFILHYVYLAENAGLTVAKRFREAVQTTYAELAAMPGMGAPGKVKGAKYESVRLWRVNDFENYIVAYRVRDNTVAIERLIHAKQDYQRILR